LEDPYKEGRCDLTLYEPNSGKSLWIEIKVNGACKDLEYIRWIKDDIQKLKRLRNKNKHKYLLVTSIKDKRPSKNDWRNLFKKNFPGVTYNPDLFNSFKTEFSNGKNFIPGYYTVCLLKVD